MKLNKLSEVFGFILILASTIQAFDGNPSGFPKEWSLNNAVRSIKNIEFKAITDKKNAWEGDTFAFVRGHLMSKQFPVSAGDELEISFYAKDPDEKYVSCSLYVYTRSGSGVLNSRGGVKGFSHKAGTDWTFVSGKITIPETSEMKTPINAVIVVLASETGAYFDYPSISHIKKGEFKNPEYAVYEAAGRAKFALEDYPGAREAFKNALKLAQTEDERKLILSQMEETDRTEKIATTAEKAKTVFKKADAFEKERRYREARKEYEAIKKQSGMDYLKEIALFNIARLYSMEKDYANAHKTYEKIFALPGLTPCYRIYGLFRQAETCLEQKDYIRARQLYEHVKKTQGATEHNIFRAALFTGDSYRLDRKHSQARKIYENLLREQETSSYPHEDYRLDLRDRLESIEGLADGAVEKSIRQKRVEWVNSPKYSIYVSLEGKDTNPGTKEKPFATVQRAQEEVRKIKAQGMPEGGIAIYIRGGKYFITDTITFEKEDSGTENSPIVYRSYPKEKVRIIGGKQVTDFKSLTDPDILRKLPEGAKGKIWVADLKAQKITDYGQLLPRGHSYPYMQPGAMELFFNTKPMQLARWPKEGWEKVADLVTPEGDEKIRGGTGYIQKGRFIYSGDRPERWQEEKNIMVAGYFLREWDKVHYNVSSIDTDKHIINLEKDNRFHKSNLIHFSPVMKDTPYYFYNIFSELSAPGEFYIDRDAGKLYFYPPDKIEGSEIILSTLNSSIINIKDASNMVLYGLSLEGTWQNAIEMSGGRNNLIAGCTMRNTGILGILINDGWNHGVVGCDIYDTGEGGVKLTAGHEEKIIRGGHCVENNLICRFNRFSFGGGKFAISMYNGAGNRASHNLVYDAPYLAVTFSGNDNIIEYNEIYDVMYEGQGGG
ncbi:MAG TPA: right-handed parallel beta-helix repeat-containing protein, partial [bacterium]|nr:right-handed parallel beta-helix repeat-containing protein [bacterium]